MAYNKSSLQFGNIADINNGHYLVMPEVDPIIKSVLNKEASPFYKRVKRKPESVETFRWVEETTASRTATMIDPRAITSTANAGIGRVEKLGKLKGMSNRINYGLFDTELTKNGMFSYVLQDDLQNMYTDMILLEMTKCSLVMTLVILRQQLCNTLVFSLQSQILQRLYRKLLATLILRLHRLLRAKLLQWMLVPMLTVHQQPSI